MTRAVLQKLLHPGMAAQISERGYDQVGGHVVNAGDASVLTTPAAMLAAYQVGGDWGEWVDVVRFTVPVCATVTLPGPAGQRPWPTYPHGFLSPVGDALVPVWVLAATRYPPGAELWRIHADASQERRLWYAGAARGWVGARGWRPAARFLGTRATWQGTEYTADVAGEDVELTSFQEPVGEGWSQPRAATWTRTVPIAECEVFEPVFTATYQGVPVRVLEVARGFAHVQVTGDDPEVAQRIGAEMIDLGVFEHPRVPVEQLEERQLVANVLANPQGAR